MSKASDFDSSNITDSAFHVFKERSDDVWESEWAYNLREYLEECIPVDKVKDLRTCKLATKSRYTVPLFPAFLL